MARKNDKQFEIDKLREQIYWLETQKRDLDARLEKITSAKTFKLWQTYAKYKRTALTESQKRTNVFTAKAKQTIPLWMRKKIKAKIGQYVPDKLAKSNGVIDNEHWQEWLEMRDAGSMDIFIFGITTFDFRFQRPQHFATQFAKKGHRVFYVETEFVPYKGSNKGQVPVKIEPGHVKNLYKVTLSATKNLFIYRDVPSDADKKIMMTSLKQLIKDTWVINPIAKIDHPFWTGLAKDLAMPIVYDCMDEHAGFKETGKKMHQQEIDLCAQSELVLVASDYLIKKIKAYEPKQMLVVKNAGDYEFFSKAKQAKTPDDIANLPKPIIGYYGAVAEWFDAAILEAVAKANPNASIVLVGTVSGPKVEAAAKKYQNIHLLGERPYPTLPSYLKAFDVCMIPFLINDLIKATSPVKLFEYLSAGKPIVTTDIPEVRQYSDIVYVAKNEKDYVAKIAKALNEKDAKVVAKRQKLASENTWGLRSDDLLQAFTKILFPKVSAIILSYFSPAYVKKCIESVLDRSFYPNFELIIVDNHSDAETIKVIERYQKDPRVRIILNRENYGFGKGNNIGMKNAKGDYIVILNNDTMVTPGWLGRLVYYASFPGVGLVGPVANMVGNEARIKIDYNPEDRSSMEQAAHHYTSQHWGQKVNLYKLGAFCWILAKQTYQKYGGFDPRYGKAMFEDDDFCMVMRSNNLSLVCAHDVFVHHYSMVSLNKMKKADYDALWDENKKKFEEKWQTPWVPHSAKAH